MMKDYFVMVHVFILSTEFRQFIILDSCYKKRVHKSNITRWVVGVHVDFCMLPEKKQLEEMK